MRNFLNSLFPNKILITIARFILGSLSNNVFERRTSTGSGFFSFFDGGFAQIFSQIASIKVKKLRNTNFISSRHVKRENTSLPVDVRRSKTSLLKLPTICETLDLRDDINLTNTIDEKLSNENKNKFLEIKVIVSIRTLQFAWIGRLYLVGQKIA